jgi:hypothetical protein
MANRYIAIGTLREGEGKLHMEISRTHVGWQQRGTSESTGDAGQGYNRDYVSGESWREVKEWLRLDVKNLQVFECDSSSKSQECKGYDDKQGAQDDAPVPCR